MTATVVVAAIVVVVGTVVDATVLCTGVLALTDVVAAVGRSVASSFGADKALLMPPMARSALTGTAILAHNGHCLRPLPPSAAKPDSPAVGGRKSFICHEPSHARSRFR